MTAQEHLELATERALEYYDMGDEAGALASFISDVGKHDGTAHIQHLPVTLMIIRQGFYDGREAFKRAMLGFAVIEGTRKLADRKEQTDVLVAI